MQHERPATPDQLPEPIVDVVGFEADGESGREQSSDSNSPAFHFQQPSMNQKTNGEHINQENKNGNNSGNIKQIKSFTIDHLLGKNKKSKSDHDTNNRLLNIQTANYSPISFLPQYEEENPTIFEDKFLNRNEDISQGRIKSPNSSGEILLSGSERIVSETSCNDRDVTDRPTVYGTNIGDSGRPRFEWLQCTRYRPPKLPRE